MTPPGPDKSSRGAFRSRARSTSSVSEKGKDRNRGRRLLYSRHECLEKGLTRMGKIANDRRSSKEAGEESRDKVTGSSEQATMTPLS